MADNILGGSELETRLASIFDAHGVTVTANDNHRLSGTQEAIKAKWFLGGRKVVYRMSCDVDAASRAIRFRESAVESSWGIPPPTLTVETTSQRGTRVSESRTDRGPGGGGTLEYGSLRQAIEQAVRDNGWQFAFESGRLP